MLKVESDAILAEVELILAKSDNDLPRSKPFQEIDLILSLDEVNEMAKNIAEGCGMASIYNPE